MGRNTIYGLFHLILTPEWLTPLLAVLPGKCVALTLTEVKGYNPDQPKGLTKVTETF